MGMYRTLFYVGLIVALLCLLLSVVLFFVLKIPKALGVVTGRTQKKAIEEIRASGYESTSKKDAIHSGRERIHVRNAEMDTGALHKQASGTLSGTLEKSVAKEEEKSSGSTRRRYGKGRAGKDVSLEHEETEVLGFEVPEQKVDPSTIGGAEDETDVLSADGGSERSSDSGTIKTARGRTYGNDEETDVLSASGEPSQKGMEEEATDVLMSGPRDYTETDEVETDVLVSGSEHTPQDEEIVGRYSAEETAVLRSIHVKPEEGSGSGKGIRVLYSETIVHTEESLLS